MGRSSRRRRPRTPPPEGHLPPRTSPRVPPLRWLRPPSLRGGFRLFLALMRAGLGMIEPLLMRYIIDRVPLSPALNAAARFPPAPGGGGVSDSDRRLRPDPGPEDYRQKLLNIRVMLSLRRALFERLLHLLPKLWRTGGILSRITGDVDTTTGLLQMAVISPSISV